MLLKVNLFVLLTLFIFITACTGMSKKQLTAISNKMYNRGNVKYILIDAVIDGFLEDGKSFSFTLNNGVISFNNKPLQEPYLSAYHSKLAKLYVTPLGNMSINSTKLQIKRIDNDNDKDLEIAMKELIRIMFADGITNDTVHFSVQFDKSGLYLNQNRIADTLAAKYVGILEKYPNVKPKNVCANFGFSYAAKSPE